VCLYNENLSEVIETHPGADVLGARVNENAVWTAIAATKLTRKYWTMGRPNQALAKASNRILTVTGLILSDLP
jgi:hypothetical protein